MKTSLTWAVLLFCCLPAAGQDAAARRIQQRYEAAVPSDKALSFYSLDWAANLAEAKKRAAQERRPILHIGVTNITAGCNFYAGHT